MPISEGAWQARGQAVWGGNNPQRINIIASTVTDRPREENEANARLMAASKKLAAACRAILECDDDTPDYRLHDAQDAAREALADAGQLDAG